LLKHSLTQRGESTRPLPRYGRLSPPATAGDLWQAVLPQKSELGVFELDGEVVSVVELATGAGPPWDGRTVVLWANPWAEDGGFTCVTLGGLTSSPAPPESPGRSPLGLFGSWEHTSPRGFPGTGPVVVGGRDWDDGSGPHRRHGYWPRSAGTGVTPRARQCLG
jgi:hypothetical protein